MTKYWVNIDECQRILDSIKDILDERQAVPPTREDFSQIDHASFTAEESGASGIKEAADGLHTALFDFEEQKFKRHYRELYETTLNNVSAMQDAVSYYASGDAEMALWNNQQQAGDLENFPELVSPSGNAPPEGHTGRWEGSDIKTLEGGYVDTPFSSAHGQYEEGTVDGTVG